MLRHLAALLLLAACAGSGSGFGPTTAQDRMIVSESGSITGGYSIILTPDDRLIYDAYGNRAAPDLPGWRWLDAQQVSGQAGAAVPGAWQRAQRLLASAPAPAPIAACGAENASASTDSIRLTRGTETLFARQYNAARCAGSPSASQENFTALARALRAAILPDGWSIPAL